jgi:hypothetical protein
MWTLVSRAAFFSCFLLCFLPVAWASQDGLPDLTPSQKEWMKTYDGYSLHLFQQFPDMDPTQRIKLHLSTLEARFRAKDDSKLSLEARRERAKNLDRLREYWRAGQFPQNDYEPGGIFPIFIDRRGTHCAVGYLVDRSGFSEAADTIAKKENFALLRDIQNPQLDPWIAQSGLTKEECAMIQPIPYPPPPTTPSPTFTPTPTIPIPPSGPTPCFQIFAPPVSCVAADAAGNVYATTSTQECFDFDCPLKIKTTKYGPDGTEIWSRNYGSGGEADWSEDIVVDSAGNVYVAGGADTVATDGWNETAYLLYKYDSAGNFQWAVTYNSGNPIVATGSEWMWERAAKVALDGSGNVYVMGQYLMNSFFPPAVLEEWHTLQYNSNGVLTRDWQEGAQNFTVDAGGNIYYINSGYYDFSQPPFVYIWKMNSAHVELWNASYQTGSSFQTFHPGIALDASGNVNWTGDPGTGQFDNNGNFKWAKNYVGGSDLGMGPAGEINVVSTWEGSLRATQLDANGAMISWRDDPLPDYNATAATDGGGNFYVADGGGLLRYSVSGCIALPTATPTATASIVPTSTSTSTPSNTLTATSTVTATFTPTITFTPTPTSTATHTMTPTATATPTFTPTVTPTFTSTATPTPSEDEDKVVLSPNPLAEGETVQAKFHIPTTVAKLRVCLYTVGYRKVCENSLSNVPAGWNSVSLEGKDSQGVPLANGVYYVSVEVPQGKKIGKLLILK